MRSTAWLVVAASFYGTGCARRPAEVATPPASPSSAPSSVSAVATALPAKDAEPPESSAWKGAWARYLWQIHVRVHPIFADGYIASLEELPKTHALNDPKLAVHIEIALREDGAIDHLAVVRPSGVTAFDVAALDAFKRAAPFGAAPTAILGPDGLAYVRWELRRGDEHCSTKYAHPYPEKP
jgi:TonB family protein